MATGFNNTPPASEYRSNNSWGRTRSPKNILSTHRAGIDASGTGKTLTVGGTATVTCITENQRFLHVVCSATTGVSAPTLTVTGLMYAAGNTSMALRTVHNQACTLDAAGETLIIDISGIDRVVFTATGDGADSITFFAACTTF
jgi:hypothetical protein